MMATSEFDPLFVKGLRLLHSKSKDSTEQLKQLLDEVIAQSKQSSSKDRVYTAVKLEGESKLHLKKASRDTTETSSYSKHSSDDSRERKSEKRQTEKAKQDSFESDAKIPKLEPPQVYSYYPSSPDLPKLDQYVTKKEEDTDSSDDNADADDFAMEIMEMGLACIICNQIEVTQGNQLIECQECHSLYHQLISLMVGADKSPLGKCLHNPKVTLPSPQIVASISRRTIKIYFLLSNVAYQNECHRPPATDYDYNDPRRVWYCAKCVKNMKKMATKTQKTAKSSVAIPPKEPVSQAKATKSESSPPALILPFKRTELKTTISQGSSQTTANKPIGLAGLAANFGGRTTTAPTTSTASSVRGTKTSTSGINLKTHTPFSSSATTKTSPITSTSLSKTSSSTAFQNLSLTTTSQSSTTLASQKSSTSTTTKGLGLLSAVVASATRGATTSASSGNGNNTHKVASCSPLMSADKRLQIMKKKASKLQERRRLSTK